VHSMEFASQNSAQVLGLPAHSQESGGFESGGFAALSGSMSARLRALQTDINRSAKLLADGCVWWWWGGKGGIFQC
jgi:hypothetical protein